MGIVTHPIERSIVTSTVHRAVLGLAVLLFVVPPSNVASAQQRRIQTGEFEGFTESSTEHIINRLQSPLIVRTLRGTINVARGGDPLEGVVFEVRGPGSSKAIRSAQTGRYGRFRIRRLHPGTYTFKVTRDGFQSVAGQLVVSKTAPDNLPITVQLEPGV